MWYKELNARLEDNKEGSVEERGVLWLVTNDIFQQSRWPMGYLQTINDKALALPRMRVLVVRE